MPTERVAFVTNIVSPYRKPVFARLVQAPGWTFRVFISSTSEFDRSWQVNTEGLPVESISGYKWKRKVHSSEPVPFDQVIELHLPLGLWQSLGQYAPTVVIAHELGIRTLLAAMYCRAKKIPLVIWAYQSRISATQGRRRKRFRQALLQQASCCVGMGKQARQVLLNWGVPEARLVDAPNAANHPQILKALAEPGAESKIQAIRRRWASGKRMAIVVGRLIPLKGTSALITAWCRLSEAWRSQWELVFVGGGPLDKLVLEHQAFGITLAGSLPPEEVPYWYAASDLHIFPSLGDVWGLAVNEASHCATPSLCSVHAGCHDDLIAHGVDGFTCDPSQPDLFLLALKTALGHPDLRAIGSKAKAKAATFTLDQLAGAFVQAVHIATENRAQAACAELKNAP
jgi:glycosyltransferase involved in cell wall biosynthesis